MRIRVCDDVEEIAEEWVKAVQSVVPSEFDVARMTDAKDQVSTLLTRKLATEKGDDPLGVDTQFDAIDVLIVDYDLVHLDDTGSRTTGEGVARLARTFSSCGAIVVMNQYRGPQFDLGMRGHLDSFGDVNVDAGLIGQPALWNRVEPAVGRFNPTTWIPLPQLVSATTGLKAKFKEAGFDAAVLPLLGLETDAVAELSDTAFGFLSVDAQTADQLTAVTIRDFLMRSLDEAIVDCLSNKRPELLFAFAALRLAKWLDRAVLRPMDVLVDGPHLVDRLPFLIDAAAADPADPAQWARAATASADSPLRWNVLGQYRNELASSALGRAIFDWHRLSNDEQIDEMQDAYVDEQPARFYLAEDTSRFVEKDALTRFRADFHNFGDRRGVEKLEGVTYGPMRRISFG